MTLGAIAAEAGVTAGALVQRFGSKRKLRHLLRLGRAARARHEQLLADAVVAGELRPATDVRALARMIEVAIGGSYLAWTLYREGPANERVAEIVQTAEAIRHATRRQSCR